MHWGSSMKTRAAIVAEQQRYTDPAPTRMSPAHDSPELRRTRRVVLEVSMRFADAAQLGDDFEHPKRMAAALDEMERAAIAYRDQMARAGRR